jgi:uncharacterized protein YdiU (UPF0061 family)
VNPVRAKSLGRNPARANAESYAYPAFDQIDGRHPYQGLVPEGVVLYPVKRLTRGKVAYLNFELAREMGLLPQDHTDQMTPSLEKKLLETFAIQIINEYDVQNKTSISADLIKPHRYMATRYLQLQHPDKTGKTSGDGRSIWNGRVHHAGRHWDLSSCGTGATRLSPYYAASGKFARTGDPKLAYGNGLCDLGESVSSALMSAHLKGMGIATEQVLTVIELPGQRAITVRAALSLLRPSHVFYFLRQRERENLKAVLDFYVSGQIQNGDLAKSTQWSELDRLTAERFAKAAARFEADYIFVWLDWDGDNVLLDGGIIDYGSVRQFGLCHHRYRYDDGDRWSTRLFEQRHKAREIVQTMIQAVHYAKTGKITSKEDLRRHPITRHFDRTYHQEALRLRLTQVGVRDSWSQSLLTGSTATGRKTFTQAQTIDRILEQFERRCSRKATFRVSDGEMREAIYCVRTWSKNFPRLLLQNPNQDTAFLEKAFACMHLDSTPKRDRVLNRTLKRSMERLVHEYQNLVEHLAVAHKRTRRQILLELAMRSQTASPQFRITGDAAIETTHAVIKNRARLSIQDAIRAILDPEHLSRPHYSKILRIVEDYRHGV